MAVKYTVSSATIRKMMTSAGVKAEVHERGLRLAAKANEVPSTTSPEHDGLYYEAVEASDAKRARTRVQTTGPRAVNHEAITQALLRAVSDAR
ncbi:hypothetical protein [Mycobacteroides abscessus]|uniref:hypothetical protein n=1 Tax=Mycobacteroides abscessus TaxID=36809 RepID=UPI00092A43C3|nr:hypothetical protein [Mycobacteroides abscessus]MDO3237454.1 hypothetical protein [Mycobacteroides abscessus subsp. abscessus]SHQ37800.1 Uncharacterised protein [Mycobacteroides abscessus subsp. abscessus]SHQ40220.1 Uncharacterised protein [Mycobacteroides abscessus subsp. abscessus]SHQ52662.1 Uncharacterised protein [Mycobacteroides abscessus subsp. abscessus]SHQ53367.1 Uncharacterised protein [Mycobacteroides abscessus subsp. abscessus]